MNHDKYREREHVIREQTRLRVQKHREKQKEKEHVTHGNATKALPSASVSVSSSVSPEGGPGETPPVKQTKPPKTAYGEFKNVTLTDAEHKKLLGGHGAARLSKGIAELDDYIESSGKRYKSHYAVLKPTGWVWKKLDEAKASTGPKATNGNDYFQPNG